MRLPSLRRLRRPALKDRYTDNRANANLFELLSDDDVERLNSLLPWQCFTVDSGGRPFGGVAWSGKRDVPQPVPDPRILRFHERFNLSDKHVLEIGCFEGVHTIALSRLANRVTAIDARVENVVKTVVRCAFFDERPRVFVYDAERGEPGDPLLRADLCHHVGVLYHLEDPVSHLRRLATCISRGMMLDTHYSDDENATEEYEVDGDRVRFRRYRELGRGDVFSGLGSTSKWLRLDDITDVLREAGFGTVEVVEKRDERNGPRVLLFAEKA
jgi:SAM-dependent methyltransferase